VSNIHLPRILHCIRDVAMYWSNFCSRQGRDSV